MAWACLLALGLPTAHAPAATSTWSSNAASGSWRSNLNWSGRRVPIAGPDTELLFGESITTALNNDLANPVLLGRLSFNALASNFVIGGFMVQLASGGRLANANASAVQTLNLELHAMGDLQVDATGDILLNGVLRSGDSNAIVTKTGDKSLSLNAANSLTGQLLVNAGAVVLGHASALAQAAVTVGASGKLVAAVDSTLTRLAGSGTLDAGGHTLTLALRDSTSFNGSLSGSGRFVKADATTLTLGGASSFVGDIQLQGGTTVLSHGDALVADHVDLGQFSRLGVGTLRNVRMGSLTGLGTVDLGSAEVELVSQTGIRADEVVEHYGGVLSGTGTLTLAPWRTLQLDGVNTFSGTVRVGSGSWLRLGRGDALANATVWLQGVGPWPDRRELTLGSGVSATIAGLAGMGRVDIGGDQALTLVDDRNNTFDGSVSGTGLLVKDGKGTWSITADHFNRPYENFSGTLELRQGTLEFLDDPYDLGMQNLVLDMRGGRVAWSGALVYPRSLGLGGLSGVGVLSGMHRLEIDSRRSVTFEGDTDVPWLIVRWRSNTLASQTFQGGQHRWDRVENLGSIIVDGGSVDMRSASALEVHSLGQFTLRGGATLTQSVATGGTGTLNLLSVGGTVSVETGARWTAGTFVLGTVIPSNLDNTAWLKVSGAGQVQASFVELMNWTREGGAAVRVSGAGSLLQVAQGLLVKQAPWTAPLEYPPLPATHKEVLLVQDGGEVRAGELRLESTEATSALYAVAVDGGSLVVGRLTADGAGLIDLRSDPMGAAAMAITTASRPDTEAVYRGSLIGGGTLAVGGQARQALVGSLADFTGMVVVQDQAHLRVAGLGPVWLRAQDQAVLQIDDRSLGDSLVEALPGAQALYTSSTLVGGTLMGAGTHNLAGVRTLVNTRLAAGSQVALGASTSLRGVVASGALVNADGQQLNWAAGGLQSGVLTVRGTTTVSGWSVLGGTVQVAPGGLLTVAGGDLQVGGGSVLRVGSAAAPGGTLTLSSSGAAVRLNGAQLLNNGVLNGDLVVDFGSVAKGAGVFDGAVTVGDGGRFSPGNSPGAVTTGDVRWGEGGSYLVELASASGTAGTAWDLWQINGTLHVDAGTSPGAVFTISLATLDAANQAALLAGFDAGHDQQWTILQTTGGIVGFGSQRVRLDSSGFANDLKGGQLRLQQQGGDLVLSFQAVTAVPEPATWALWGAGLLGWILRRRHASKAVG